MYGGDGAPPVVWQLIVHGSAPSSHTDGGPPLGDGGEGGEGAKLALEDSKRVAESMMAKRTGRAQSSGEEATGTFP